MIASLAWSHVKKQLEASDMFVDHSIDGRLSFKQGTYLYLHLNITGMTVDDLTPLAGCSRWTPRIPQSKIYARSTTSR